MSPWEPACPLIRPVQISEATSMSSTNLASVVNANAGILIQAVLNGTSLPHY